jgi:regulator of protease activity HflC (stomatin/prohibitin superfamily)
MATQTKEYIREATSPVMGFSLFVGLEACAGFLALHAVSNGAFLVLGVAVVLGLVGLFMLGGFFTLKPNEVAVTTFFGTYAGTVQGQGLHWINPLLNKENANKGLVTFETEKMKVNDKNGNPVEVRAVIKYHISDAARATFDVRGAAHKFVEQMAETALRNVVQIHAYDSETDGEITLRGHNDEVAAEFVKMLKPLIEEAGCTVRDARISDLSYAPEIAAAMLKKQQAEATVAARKAIAKGAVSIIKETLKGLEDAKGVTLSAEDKSATVRQLLVVLCSDSGVKPVLEINEG